MLRPKDLQRLARGARIGSPAGDARLGDLRSTARAGLARAIEDLQLVLEPAALAESVVVGVEGRPPQLDGPPQDVAGRCVDGPYLLRAQGVGLARGVNARGEEHLVDVDVA